MREAIWVAVSVEICRICICITEMTQICIKGQLEDHFLSKDAHTVFYVWLRKYLFFRPNNMCICLKYTITQTHLKSHFEVLLLFIGDW